MLTALERIAPIAKSAFAARGSRPRPIDHYETIRATRLVTDRPELCLVDDVVTKGSTLIAAASRLQEVYPEARIVAFALIRTMGFVDDIDRIIEPTTGLITWSGDEADRNP